MAFIQGVNRNQKLIFPEYLEDSIGEENPVRVIDAYADTLNLKQMGFTKTIEYRCGAPSYNPKDLLKLYIYGYINAIRSSRKLERETYRNIEVMWLLRKIQPDFKTIADFRKENKNILKKVFKDFTLLCKELELYGEKLIAVDGTKIKANNSKKNNYTNKKIERQLKYIEEKSEEYFKMLAESDKDESTPKKYTKEQIQNKLKKLEKRQKKYEELQKTLEENEANEISTVDKDARLMDNKNNGLDISYNVQIAADAKHKLIAAYDVINNPTDQGNLNKMAEKAKEVLDVKEIELLADKG
jgi:transposase